MKFSEALKEPKPKAKPPVKAKAQVFDLEAAKNQFAWVHVELARIQGEAVELVVDSLAAAKAAVGMGDHAKDLAKKIITEQDRIVEKPETYVKSVKAFCKSFVERLVSNPRKTNPDCIEAVLKKKVGDYQYSVEIERREAERKAQEETRKLQEKLRLEAEEANRKAAEEAARKAEEEARARKASEAEIEAARKKAEEEAAKTAIEAPTVVAPVLPKHDSVVRADTGASSYIKRPWKGVVVNPDEVPREFCSPDQKKINQGIKAGIRSISGVNIFESLETTFRK